MDQEQYDDKTHQFQSLLVKMLIIRYQYMEFREVMVLKHQCLGHTNLRDEITNHNTLCDLTMQPTTPSRVVNLVLPKAKHKISMQVSKLLQCKVKLS